MDIKEYKMCDIISFKTGIDKNNINSFNSINSLPWIKLGNINEHNVNYDSCEYLSDTKNIVIKGDILLVWSCDIGKSIIINDKSLFSTAFYKLVPKKDNIYLNKYIHYFFIKNKKEIGSLGNGSVLKKANMKILGNFILKLPNISVQQSIIDIIEPKEKLFLKFKNLVRIDNIENCKNDMKNLIDIIEPFDLEMSIRIKKNNLYLKFIKNSFFTNENEKLFLSNIIIPTKDAKIENCNEVIDLSSINSDSVTFFNFKKTNDFSSNIFSTRENDIFISSIRPNLKKYGITAENKNILGTLFNFRPINQIDRGFILYCLSSNDFQNFLIQISEGTKMPIIKWAKFKNYEFLTASINEKNILNIFFDLIKNNNKILKILEKIKINLIEIFIK